VSAVPAAARDTPTPATSRLDAEVVVERGDFQLDAHLTVEPGEVVALLGPNGAGKTTLLRALAGLVPLTEGRVELAGVVLEDVASGRRLETADRAVGVVFQDHLLFPHLSARDNVAFAARARGVPSREARARAQAWLDRVGLATRADARPPQLSGGQAQRVALVRALASDPALLLLDEPLAALDVETRQQVRGDLRDHLAAFAGPAVLVTHDPVEALTLADRLVVLEAGRIVQDDAPAEVTRAPRSPWIARLVGLNLYRGRAEGTEVVLGDGALRLRTATEVDGEVLALVHPRAVALHGERPLDGPRNVWEAQVGSVDLEGTRVRVHLLGPIDVVAEVTPTTVARLGLARGATVHVAVKATEVDVRPA
jgi:molybdate transport system ATP-binding protein